jgi:hypothetical protein
MSSCYGGWCGKRSSYVVHNYADCDKRIVKKARLAHEERLKSQTVILDKKLYFLIK